MFAFEVEYLLGRVFAATFSDDSEPEWPPAPARLYSALAASYFENDASAGEKDALEWLERCGPPHIHAGEPGTPAKVGAYVPTNYAGGGLPATRLRQPRYFPAQAPSHAKVTFAWPDREPAAPIRSALESLAERTTSLGRACSLVWMRVSNSPAGEDTYVPDVRGGYILRVATPGRLDELASLYAANRRPSAGALVAYRKHQDPIETKQSSSQFGQIVFLRRTEGPGLLLDAALTVTEAARAALISLAANNSAVGDLLHGHATGRIAPSSQFRSPDLHMPTATYSAWDW